MTAGRIFLRLVTNTRCDAFFDVDKVIPNHTETDFTAMVTAIDYGNFPVVKYLANRVDLTNLMLRPFDIAMFAKYHHDLLSAG